MIVDLKYAKAYTEVLAVLELLSPEEYYKIPIEKIRFFEKNKDKYYDFFIDPKIPFSEYNISREAYAILVSLFKDYFITDEKAEALMEMLKANN